MLFGPSGEKHVNGELRWARIQSMQMQSWLRGELLTIEEVLERLDFIRMRRAQAGGL